MALRFNDLFEVVLRKNSGLKSFLRDLYFRLNGKSDASTIDQGSIERLTDFYQESNSRVAALLKSKGYVSLPSWLD